MKVTREMIGAAHDICLKKGDFVLSADLLERIYSAMESRREKDDQYFDGDSDDVLRAALFQMQEAAKYNGEQWEKSAEALVRQSAALENCRLLAARHRKEDWALLILGFCAEGGVVGSVTRTTEDV